MMTAKDRLIRNSFSRCFYSFINFFSLVTCTYHPLISSHYLS